jgi:hypothetical protein
VGANYDDSKSVGLFPYILSTISVKIFLWHSIARYKENEDLLKDNLRLATQGISQEERHAGSQ